MKVFAASKPRNDLHVNKYFNNHLIRICVMCMPCMQTNPKIFVNYIHKQIYS